MYSGARQVAHWDRLSPQHVKHDSWHVRHVDRSRYVLTVTIIILLHNIKAGLVARQSHIDVTVEKLIGFVTNIYIYKWTARDHNDETVPKELKATSYPIKATLSNFFKDFFFARITD